MSNIDVTALCCSYICGQDVSSYNRWYDKKQNKAFRNIPASQKVGLGGVAYIENQSAFAKKTIIYTIHLSS